MSRSRYLPLCDYMSRKIGGSPAQWVVFNAMAAQGIGAGSHALFLRGVSKTLAQGQEFLMSAMVMGMTTGMIGAVAAIYLSDRALPPILRARGVGVTRGGQIIRAAQLAGYAAPVALSLGIHFAVASAMEKATEPPEPSASFMQPLAAPH